MRIAIIGAGPAGLTAAYQLLKSKRATVDIFEGSDAVGGLSKSVRAWDYRLDLGPHRFFTKDPAVMSLWRELIEDKYVILPRQTRILYRDQLFEYPLKPFGTLKKLGPFESALSVVSYVASQFAAHNEKESFQDWVQRRFGSRLFRTFFKAYTEKLWGIPCSELDAEFGKQRIQKFSLSQAIFSSLGIGARHRTLVDEFPYADLGTGNFWEEATSKVQSMGGNLFLNSRVQKLRSSSGGLILSAAGQPDKEYNHIISTMPLTHLVEALPEVPHEIRKHCEQLRFRNTILAYLLLDRSDLFPDQWLYINSSALKCGRITNFNNWSSSITGKEGTTAICVEYWAQSEDELWNLSEEEFLEMVRAEIETISLFRGINCLDSFRVKIPNSYPVYRRDYKFHLAPIIEFLKRDWPQISPIGRYGSFKYNNQDHSMKMGMMVAENLTAGSKHNLWSVNSDTDYQESDSGSDV
jgi:protoporphyrinogen oxidase